MQYTINEFRKKLFQEVYDVYQVFINFFGEDKVDLQNMPRDEEFIDFFQTADVECSEYEHVYEVSDSQLDLAKTYFRLLRPFILVYWPRVKVTNEYNKFVYIQDLFAKIELDANGKIPNENRGFALNRATYPVQQWMSGYLHSHIRCIPKDNLQSFELPCLGTGPIIRAIDSLRASISEGFNELKWMLFCQELSQYVQVESITGVPYKRLENIGARSKMPEYERYNLDLDRQKYYPSNAALSKENIRKFVQYYLKHGHLAFNYQKGRFVPGMSCVDYCIDVSNAFIEFFNARFNDRELADGLFAHSILKKYIYSEGAFYSFSDTRNPRIEDYVGRKICTFKGRDITLNILQEPEQTLTETTVLSYNTAMFILKVILKTINYNYVNEYSKHNKQSNDSKSQPSPAGKTVCFI